MSSSPFRIRATASVRALTARKTVSQHAWELSDRSLHNVMAQVDQSRPRRPGQAQDRRTPLDTLLATLLARPDEQLISSNSSSVNPVVYSIAMALLVDSWSLFLRHP